MTPQRAELGRMAQASIKNLLVSADAVGRPDLIKEALKEILFQSATLYTHFWSAEEAADVLGQISGVLEMKDLMGRARGIPKAMDGSKQ